jgi:hypothetical protein
MARLKKIYAVRTEPVPFHHRHGTFSSRLVALVREHEKPSLYA